MKNIKLSIDSYDIVMDDPSFMVLDIDVLSDGKNHHGSIFYLDDIKASVKNIWNKPLNCIIRYGDFSDHARSSEDEKKQVGVGTVPETNDVRFVVKGGKTFLRIRAIVWKYLYPQVAEILKRRKDVSVSMEITPIKVGKDENGYLVIKEWRYEAITLLGMFVKPAIENANAVVIKYSSDEDYINSVMVKYGIFVDEILVPTEVSDSAKTLLSTVINQKSALNVATELTSKNKFTYQEIISLKNEFEQIDVNENSDIVKFYSSTHIWLNDIIKEKQGGFNVDKIQEILTSKFSGTLSYVSHDDNRVYCFDYDSAQYKAFKYAVEEVDNAENEEEKEVSCSVEEEGTKVYKLKETGEFADTLEEGQEAEDSKMYSISQYSELVSELERVKTEFSEKSTAIEELNSKLVEKDEVIAQFSIEKIAFEEEKNGLNTKVDELESKILEFSTVAEELTTLKDYKMSKEKEEKNVAVNGLYSKYKEYLTDEEITSINAKSETLNVEDIQKEVYSIVLPKIEQKMSVLSATQKDDGSAKNLQFTTVPKTQKDDEAEDNSLVGRLARL